jgi:hypothetical protein
MKRVISFMIGLLIVTSAHANHIRQITLTTNDIIYDPVSRKIYASVPSSAGGIGNSVTSIDPFTGTLGQSVFIGSEPNKLAISDNSQYLYVGLDGAASVRRYDIQTQTAGLQLSLGNDPYFGPYFVEDMEVLPGNPEAVAVSRKNLGISPRHAGVAIYDNGIQRPVTTPRHTGSNVIEFSNSASRLYGYNNETTEYGFRRMTVDENGVSVLDVTESLIMGFDVDIKFDNGLIYATTGRVIEPEGRMLLGTFTGISSGALVKPDSTVGRVFFLTGSGSTHTLLAFDQDTFLPIGSFDIPDVSGMPSSLIRWGARGLAFRTSDKVFLIRTAFLPAPQTDFDMDRKTDITIYRGSTGGWFILPSSTGVPYGFGFGGDASDIPVSMDCDGDEKTDAAIYRSGSWFILPSSTRIPYGIGFGGDASDKPVPGDYDGDGKTDIAVYRSSTGAWFILPSSTGTPYGVAFGGDPADKPVPRDYDGDGKTDIAVYRTSTGAWFIYPSGGASIYGVGFGGEPSDKPVPGDYDGDGKTDIAIYRANTGAWFVLPSSTGTPYGVGFGGDASDKPVPGDYDGDGKTDIAIYRSGSWFILSFSTGTAYGVGFGGDPSDIPISENMRY